MGIRFISNIPHQTFQFYPTMLKFGGEISLMTEPSLDKLLTFRHSCALFPFLHSHHSSTTSENKWKSNEGWDVRKSYKIKRLVEKVMGEVDLMIIYLLLIESYLIYSMLTSPQRWGGLGLEWHKIMMAAKIVVDYVMWLNGFCQGSYIFRFSCRCMATGACVSWRYMQGGSLFLFFLFFSYWYGAEVCWGDIGCDAAKTPYDKNNSALKPDKYVAR